MWKEDLEDETPRGERAMCGKGLRCSSLEGEAVLILLPSPAECSHMNEPDGSMWNRGMPALLNPA